MKKKKGWTITKLMVAGGLAVLMLVLKLPGAGIQAATGFVGAGGIINALVTPAAAIICLFLVKQFGAATVMFTVLGFLELPLPLDGSPGFLPKIAILFVGGVIADTLYLFLKLSKRVISLVIGGLLILYLGVAIIEIGRLFDMPGIQQTTKLFYPFLLIPAVLIGATGGYLGYLIYQKIKGTSVVRRIQK